MRDQASGLRELMQHRRGARGRANVLVHGSQPGVGAATIAANLALICGVWARVHRGTSQPTWSDFDVVVVVATCDSVGLMEAYAAIKRAAIGSRVSIAVLFNRVQQHQVVEDAFARLDRSCLRFLGRALTGFGSVPLDPHVIAAADKAQPVARAYPDSPAALALRSMADLLWLQARCGVSPVV